MSNRLAHQKSPYLLQHADNPVDWHPWEEEALAEARATNKPILLSIGYAACHWCHVMAHESFENPEIAAVMNDLFVNIKVDREERPDLDVIYQRALALMGEQGGWPLTMFLTPQGEPFWGGTYFPPTPRFGRPAFPDLLGRIATVYREQAETIATNVSTLRDALGGLSQSTPGGPIGPEIPRRLAEALTEQFDPVNGGIGQAPKFPHVPIYELVLADSLARPGAAQPGTENGPQTDPLAGARAVLFALGRMCQGGIYDHLGGGFARYTTDAAWLVPHFEKMLYDNAQLIDILRLAATASGDALYADRLKQTADWVLREMTVDGGGFAGTLDADSEGEEGRFYVWRAEEIDEILGPDAELFKSVYDVSPEGNFEGKNILNRLNHPDPLDADSEERLAQARERLLAARARRIRPGRDDKVLADWNGLMITALARAARAFHRPDWMDAARRAYGFIMDHMSSGNENRLLAHSHCDGETRETGFLDDYASMARAAVTLYETTGDPAYLHQAAIWLDTLDLDYRDRAGGYFLTAADADLLVRPKVADDGPVPSGNALAAEASARLWLLTGKDSHRRRAEAIIADFSGGLSRNAFSLAALVNVARLMQSAAQVTIIGPPGDPATESLAHVAWTAPRPDLVIQAIAPDDSLPPDHPAHDKLKVDGAAAALAYVCLGPTCSPPQTDPDSLAQFLAAPASGLTGDPHAGPVS